MVVDEALGEEDELVGKELYDSVLVHEEAPDMRKNVG